MPEEPFSVSTGGKVGVWGLALQNVFEVKPYKVL